MCPHGVEVAQQDDLPVLLSRIQVSEYVLDDELGAAVWAHSLQGVLLINGHVLWVPIHCAGAREHNLHSTAVSSAEHINMSCILQLTHYSQLLRTTHCFVQLRGQLTNR